MFAVAARFGWDTMTQMAVGDFVDAVKWIRVDERRQIRSAAMASRASQMDGKAWKKWMREME